MVKKSPKPTNNQHKWEWVYNSSHEIADRLRVCHTSVSDNMIKYKYNVVAEKLILMTYFFAVCILSHSVVFLVWILGRSVFLSLNLKSFYFWVSWNLFSSEHPCQTKACVQKPIVPLSFFVLWIFELYKLSYSEESKLRISNEQEDCWKNK